MWRSEFLMTTVVAIGNEAVTRAGVYRRNGSISESLCTANAEPNAFFICLERARPVDDHLCIWLCSTWRSVYCFRAPANSPPSPCQADVCDPQAMRQRSVQLTVTL
jgi:hypothetical protein